MSITDLKGLRYPDEYLVRMFYKEGLGLGKSVPGRVLELGCGSANNLMHFAAYGWSVVGVDNNPVCLEDARHNLGTLDVTGVLIEHDLNSILPPIKGPIHALLAPSTLYYISREAAWKCLSQLRPLLAPDAIVYLRMRLPDDHRVGRGRLVGERAWVLECGHTGEQGALNVFWHEHELLELLKGTMGMDSTQLTILRVTYENIQNGWLVHNSDIVLWGRLS